MLFALKPIRVGFTLLTACFIMAAGCFPMDLQAATGQEVQGIVKSQLQSQAQIKHYRLSTPWHKKDLEAFYLKQGHMPVWLNAKGEWQREIAPYVKMVESAGAHALDPKDYHLRELITMPLDASDAEQIAAKDIAFTNEIMHYIRDVKVGRVNPNKIFPDLFLLPQDYDVVHTLSDVLKMDADKAVAYLENFAPDHPEYKGLMQALAYYRDLAKTGDWTVISHKGLIRPGDSAAVIPIIRKRLEQFDQIARRQPITQGNTRQTMAGQNVYDVALEKKVRALQEDYHVKVDGIIGSGTLNLLNMSLKDRIEKIEMAMERWRWLPENLGKDYVFVNVAGFYAQGVRQGKYTLRTPVIVGKVAHKTPSFSSKIENVKFFPDWSVPSSIAKRYVLGKIQNNPAVIDSLGYEIYNGNTLMDWSSVNINALSESDFPPYRFRQKPGKKNALGLVRFSIDNPYSIYLHDTSKDSLFEENERTLSSGCIRVGKPIDLAKFVLTGNSDLSAKQVEDKFRQAESGEAVDTEIYPLTVPIPVHITYMTAWIGENGDVEFAPDVYGRDAKLREALKMDK